MQDEEEEEQVEVEEDVGEEEYDSEVIPYSDD